MTKTDFNFILINNEKDLLRYAFSLTSNREEAEDLLQETFLKAMSNKSRPDDKTKVKAWMFTIMRNLFINTYRKKSRANDYLIHKVNNELIPLYNSTDSNYSYNEIVNYIDNLNFSLKIPIKMYAEGYKYKEIADELDLTIGTVKSRIFTARKLLSESLSDFN